MRRDLTRHSSCSSFWGQSTVEKKKQREKQRAKPREKQRKTERKRERKREKETERKRKADAEAEAAAGAETEAEAEGANSRVAHDDAGGVATDAHSSSSEVVSASGAARGPGCGEECRVAPAKSAEVAEIERAVFRALTRLRDAMTRGGDNRRVTCDDHDDSH